MKLRRAIAEFLGERIQGLNVLARRPDGKSVSYPLATFTAIDKSTAVLGCGETDRRVRDEAGLVKKKVRLFDQETTLRIDLWAPADAEKSAEERIEELSDAVEAAFEGWRFDRNRAPIVDPTTTENLRVTAIRHVSTVDLPLDTSGAPFLARKSLTYTITHRRSFERDVEHQIKTVHMQYQG